MMLTLDPRRPDNEDYEMNMEHPRLLTERSPYLHLYCHSPGWVNHSPLLLIRLPLPPHLVKHPYPLLLHLMQQLQSSSGPPTC